MTKLLKIIARTFGGILEWVIIFIILLAFGIRTSPVQTYLATIVTNYLSDELDAKITIDKVDIVFIDRANLKGVLVLDQSGDTLGHIKSLLVNVNTFSDFQNKIHLDAITLDGGNVKLSRKKENGEFNFQFIKDYFSKPKKKDSKPIKFTVDNVYLSNLRFSYDDNRYEAKTLGMDYTHLAFKNVNLNAEDISIDKGIIKATINSFGATEKSGIDLQKMSAHAIVSANGIKLNKLSIKTARSDIKSNKFQLIYSGYADFRSFVDSVRFNSDLYETSVSFKDIAVFAPTLHGMNQQVQFSGKLSKFIKNLKVSEFELSTGKKTHLAGTINLPDFRDIENAFYQERIDYAYIDLSDIQAIRMPNKSDSKYVSLDENLRRLAYFEATDVRLDGIYSQFVLSADEVDTKIGSVNVDNGLLFTHNPVNNSFFFEKSQAGEYDVKVNSFELNKFLDSDLYGIVDGKFFLSGEAMSLSDIHFTHIEGDINQFDLANYSYSGITIKNTTVIDKVIYAEMDVLDNNLKMHYAGTIDLNGEQTMNMNIDIQKALLNKLNLTEVDSTSIIGKIHVDVVGLDPNKMTGTIIMDSVRFAERTEAVFIPDVVLKINRSESVDDFNISSSLINAHISGKVDFKTISYTFQDQLSQIFPGFSSLKLQKGQIPNSKDNFTYDVTFGDIQPVLNIFEPNLKISPLTTLKGYYNGPARDFDLHLESSNIEYLNYKAYGIQINQYAKDSVLKADYVITSLNLNDSVALDDVRFVAHGTGRELYSQITWNPDSQNESNIQWKTNFESLSSFSFNLEPSYFSLNGYRWDLDHDAHIRVDSTTILVRDFQLSNGSQYIEIDGFVSNNNEDKLNFELNDVDLFEISKMVGLGTKLEGKVNGWGYITDPYRNITYMGDMNITSLKVNDEEVGNVFVLSEWDKAANNVKLEGDMIYRDIQTFKFSGHYDVSKESNNLDFNLDFDRTNIAFVNAFLDPQVVSDVKGFLVGRLKVSGTPNRPILEGEIEMEKASAEIALLGTSFSMNGKLIADEDGFYINNMPISDAEGNTGSLIGSIYHEDYKGWNFDISINLEDDANRTDPARPWLHLPLSKFLVMNTTYKTGSMYYGKAYATGTVGIFGYTDNLDINVDVKTQKGTKIYFPMYGASELSDENNFIEFKSHDTTQVQAKRQIDYTGVELDLNFDITPDAEVKIIFNELLGDEITAHGEGLIGIKLDNVGDLKIEGTYIIRENSVYNFAMGIVKQPFFISEGGSISWTGNVLDANLNLSTYYKVRTSLGELSPELLSSGQQEVQCYLYLTESLMKPAIEFDIKVPKANEADKALISSITSDPDELNRQFFSLLLWKKFQPMKGSSGAGSNAALDLVENQINTMLSQLSEGYKLNVDLASNQLGGNDVAVGIQKGFLNDQLIITGSFGVGNNTTGDQSKSSLIGDLEIEYKLNADGTFRINVFNESNDNNALQTNNQGRFKQGVGVHYREDFNTLHDFKALQIFFDIFRKKENKRYPIRRKKVQTPVPKGDAKLEEE